MKKKTTERRAVTVKMIYVHLEAVKQFAADLERNARSLREQCEKLQDWMLPEDPVQAAEVAARLLK